MAFARLAQPVGMQVVALCDSWQERLEERAAGWDVTTYTDFEAFIEHDMDAVVLANFFHQHVPFAIKALASGKHVLSETSACKTMAEGVALARAVEKSDRIYIFGENYPYMAHIQEMRRLYQAGEVGELLFGECERQCAIGAVAGT
jgi:predicted dehydrogenase